MKKSNKILGIDLGSYNSAVSVIEGGEAKLIPNSEGNYTTPSIVAFTKDGEIKVGDPAKRQAVTNPKNTIYNIKRLMGKTYESVKSLKRPYEIVDREGKAAVKVTHNGEERIYSPEEISAMIIQKMKKTAEDYLGEEVERAIITVPAYFGNIEREATIAAGEIAGLKVERVISEPTAASLNIDSKDAKIYMVVDTGGCTSDVSVIDIGDGVYEVLSTDGDVDLGGGLIDEAIVNYLADEFLKENGIDLRKDPMSHQRLVEASEKAKIELSSSSTTDINLPYITVDIKTQTPLHLNKSLSRSKFEQLISFYVDRLSKLMNSAIEKSGKNISDISEVLLVGGTTRIVIIQDTIEKFIGKKPNKSLNPDSAVATGAAINGGVITGETNSVLLLDLISISIGIETMNGVFTKIVEANTTIPCERKETFSTASDNQSSCEIHILQGERSQASANKSLGRFTLDGIRPAPRGVPKVEVTLSIDVNSILTVTAKDLDTGKSQNIRIENSGSLSKEEIEKMKQDAIENEEADKKFKEITEKVNTVEGFSYQLRKEIDENKDKISESVKTNIESVLSRLEKAKSERNETELQDIITNYQDLTKEFYDELYKNKQGNVSGEETPQTEPVVEAEEVK